MKIFERKLKSYFPLLPESITESQKLLLYKYMVALVKYYDDHSEVVHYFDDFTPAKQIDLYSWMNLHSRPADSNKPADCDKTSRKSSNDSQPKQSWEDSEKSSTETTVIENPKFPLNPKLFNNESLKSHDQPPTTDLFIELRQKYNSLPDHLKLKHPMIYPELYEWDYKSDYFGMESAKDIILDGSNVAFGHGQFQPNGKYIKADNYNFQNNTCRFSFGFILRLTLKWVFK